MAETRIPEISDAKLQELCDRIKPIVRFADGAEGLFRSGKGWPYYIKPVDPRKTAFNMEPIPTQRAVEIAPLLDITTYHTWAYYGVFKASIAEVIAQIPEGLRDQVVAFEIIHIFELDETSKEIINEGYHMAITRLYRKTSN